MQSKVPLLSLNFAKTKRIDPRITFSRASTGTYMGSNGLIKTAQAGEARIEYNTSGTCLGLLVEESRTNLLTYSEDFRDTTEAGGTRPWVHGLHSSTSANAATAPDGQVTADKLVEDSATDYHYISSLYTYTAAAHTFSVYAKADTRSAVTLYIYDGTNHSALFDLSNGTYSGASAGVTAFAQAIGNGWYRIGITYTTAVFAGSCKIELYNGAASYTGNGTSGLYLWGAQLEAGSFPTSYISTTSASATRAADVVSMTGANFSSWYNQSEGTFVASADCASFGVGTARNVFFAQTAGVGYSTLYFRSGVSGLAYEIKDDASAQQAFITSATGLTAGTQYKSACAYKANDFSAAFSGSLGTPDSSGTVISSISMYIGFGGGSNYLNGHIAQLTYFPRRPSANSQLQGLSQ